MKHQFPKKVAFLDEVLDYIFDISCQPLNVLYCIVVFLSTILYCMHATSMIALPTNYHSKKIQDIWIFW